jgi:membrane protein
MRLTPRNFLWLLRRSVISAFDDGALSVAKGAAYSALLSFFPVLASAATILVETREDFVARSLQDALEQIVPPGSEDLVMQQFTLGNRPHQLLVVAVVVSIWAASGVIKSLIEGFQAAYRVPRNRSFLRGNVVALSLVLLSLAPLLAASVLILFGAQAETQVLHWVKVDPLLHATWQVISRAARYLLSFLTMIAVTSSLYYFGPNRRQRWHWVWPGAVVATILWFGATSGFAWYTRRIAHYNVMYGSIGAGIALLVWMYVMAVIALIGCEFNAELERAG